MISWMRRLFKKPTMIAQCVVQSPRTVVFFDGDQGSSLFIQLYKKLPRVSYHWVQNSRMNVPNRVKNTKDVHVMIPSDLGKESVDTYIAMKAVHECASSNPPMHVYIVSADMDFLDVIINAAKLFSQTRFTLMIPVNKSRSKKSTDGLPSNASVLRFKPRV